MNSPSPQKGWSRAAKGALVLATGVITPAFALGLGGPAEPLVLASAAGLAIAGALWAGQQSRRLTTRRKQRTQLSARQPLLVDAFAPLCEDAGSRLQGCGLTMVWAIGDGIESMRLPAGTTHGLLRIAQEALEEVLTRPEPAREIRLALDRLDGETGMHLRLAITDTQQAGTALPVPARRQDRRLPALQREATRLGAQLEIGGDSQGWCVELILPLDGPRQADPLPRRSQAVGGWVWMKLGR